MLCNLKDTFKVETECKLLTELFPTFFAETKPIDFFCRMLSPLCGKESKGEKKKNKGEKKDDSDICSIMTIHDADISDVICRVQQWNKKVFLSLLFSLS